MQQTSWTWLEDNWYDQLGARIRAARLAAGKSVAELANEAGMYPPELSKMENHKAEITLRTLKKLSVPLGIPVWQLAQVEGELPEAHPPQYEPWVERVADPKEKLFLRLMRTITARDRRIVMMLMEDMITSKTPKHLREKVRQDFVERRPASDR